VDVDPRLARLSEICDELPEAEREIHGRHAGFRVRKRTFAYYLDDHRGDEGIVGLVFRPGWAKGGDDPPVDPELLYEPAYIGPRGWIGLRLDAGPVDWDQVAELVTDSYVTVAPKRLAAQVEGGEQDEAG
jgi:predicted DNA-binding protein (MmcQ/YjbR family)